MNKSMIIFLLIILFFLSGVSAISPYPKESPLSLGVFQPVNWHVKENNSCPQGYQCYGGIWVPQVNVYRDMWVFGVSNNASRAELVAGEISVMYEGEDVIITASVSNTGSLTAENVKIQYFADSSSGNEFLGEKIIDIPNGETIFSSLCSHLSDGIYTFHIVVDPDNVIAESCEYNNENVVQYVIDRTPPEAEIFFDPKIQDLTVKGIDNIDTSVSIFITESIIKTKILRTYLLMDETGNTTELTLDLNHSGHQIKAKIISLNYNTSPVPIPETLFKIEYIIDNGKVKMSNQFLTINGKKVHAIYNEKKDQTIIITDTNRKVYGGYMSIILQTKKGELQYQIRVIS